MMCHGGRRPRRLTGDGDVVQKDAGLPMRVAKRLCGCTGASGVGTVLLAVHELVRAPPRTFSRADDVQDLRAPPHRLDRSRHGLQRAHPTVAALGAAAAGGQTFIRGRVVK